MWGIMVLNKIIILLFFSLAINLNSVDIVNYDFPKFFIYTEDWKPYQYIDYDGIRGISVDVMELMLKYLGSSQDRYDFEFLPWTRAYNLTMNNSDSILFLMTQTEERKDLFKWVGPLKTYNNYLYARKDRNIVINNKNDLYKYKFGSVKDDASELFLLKLGISLDSMIRANVGSDVVKVLHKGRIDMLLSETSSFLSDVETLNLNHKDFEPVYLASTSQLFFAFNKDTPDEIINRFQDAYNTLESSGKIDQIFKLYGESR